jgi:pimeloyl-ACP methyl ester carboxylesterase
MTDRLDVTVGGVRLACRIAGAPDSPPVVLLHALGDDSSSWEFVAAELSQPFRVVAPDFRGHGQSDRPGDYSFEVMRDDVLGLLDHLDLARTSVVGHSMGGTVAYLIAEAQPGRVDRLILEDTPPPFPESWSTPSRPEDPMPFDWAVVPAIIAQLNDPDPAWWDRLGGITASTLIIAGGPDSHVPQDKLRDVSRLIPTCDLLTIPAGHQVHQERPDEFVAAVLAFLRAGPAGTNQGPSRQPGPG